MAMEFGTFALFSFLLIFCVKRFFESSKRTI